MKIPYNLQEYLKQVVQETAQGLTDFEDNFDPQIRLADPKFGDFQANGTLGYAKKLKRNPRELGQLLLEALLKNPKLDCLSKDAALIQLHKDARLVASAHMREIPENILGNFLMPPIYSLWPLFIQYGDTQAVQLLSSQS